MERTRHKTINSIRGRVGCRSPGLVCLSCGQSIDPFLDSTARLCHHSPIPRRPLDLRSIVSRVESTGCSLALTSGGSDWRTGQDGERDCLGEVAEKWKEEAR